MRYLFAAITALLLISALGCSSSTKGKTEKAEKAEKCPAGGCKQPKAEVVPLKSWE